ncbi:hypothetical protein [Helicobacter ailurogastricus]|nr:hypothetical protein [Helicobacter ailurogastricus]
MMGFIFQTDNAYDWGYSNNTNKPFDLFICVESHPFNGSNGCAINVSTSDGRYSLRVSGGTSNDYDEEFFNYRHHQDRRIHYVGKKWAFILTLMPGVRLSVLERWDGARSSWTLSVFKLED